MIEMNRDSVTSSRRLSTVKQFCSRNQWATESGVRHLIFNAGKNGFKQAFVRIGRRVLIDEEKFFELLDRQQ